MVLTSFLIIFGIALIAKHQCKLLRYRYKVAEICPERIFPTGPQMHRITLLADIYPKRPTVLLPFHYRRVKRPLLSEVAGTLILAGCLWYAWNNAANFPLLLTIAFGGLSWVYITKFALIIMLKLCDYPSAKLVAVAFSIYPALLAVSYSLFSLLAYFKLYTLPF